MTAEEFIEKEYGHAWLKYDWNAGDVQDALAEYGKHCAKKARDNSFREATEMLCHKRDDLTDFESWWSEFQRKEEAE